MATPPKTRPQARDLTSGPIGRTLLLFALPTLGANVLQSLNGSINAIWIGRLLGESALAATSNANLVMFLMFSLGFGFGMAATILVGQSMGARDIVGARRAFGTAMGLFTIVSVVIAVAGWLLAPHLLRLLSTPPAAQAFALAYLRVIFLALPPMFLGLMISMALRGTGDSITPFWFMILNVAIDAGLNPFFIRGFGPLPPLGIAGSAMTTLIANYVVLIGVTIYIYARNLPIRLRGSEWRFLLPDPALLRVIVVKGLPMGLQMLVMSFSALVMIGLVNRAGVETTAAYGVAQQLWTYVQMPAMAIGAAVSAMAAQNIGARRWDRVGRITTVGVAVNVAMTAAILLVIFVSDHATMALFVGRGSPAIPIAIHIQKIASWSFILFGITLVLFATVRANGAVFAPLLILAFGVFVARIAFAWALMPRFGTEVLWWSFPFGSSITAVMAVLYYRYGNWRARGLVGATIEAEAAQDQASADGEAGGRLNPAA
ncbi:MATE family efflux transporter [Sphingomonas nostoxanthinifaciens]|uniref:MATE family efflux transporter n=1 Tax=Sphingomonas nostoxanthinifaciens TaxID=2872652 RepID=UPI001CC2007A|nr:MATE family efflux transporter [Sphingomonas nostoxanthinifaciens]UAK26235.1 MATE family efflux transporter [Sphingomonas nostoxanthinifaciens]